MMYRLERVTQPDFEPVSLSEMRAHVREFSGVTENDAQYSALITAAREWTEDYTGRALVDQTWRLTILEASSTAPVVTDAVAGPVYLGDWSRPRTGEILLRRSPVLAITSFVTVDSAGAETAVDAATYEVREADSKWPRLTALTGATWSAVSGTGMRIEFRAGYIDTSGSPSVGTVPERFKQAILLYAESLFDRDEKMMDRLQAAAERLVLGERTEWSLA